MLKNPESIPGKECTQPGVWVGLEHPRIRGGVKMDTRKGSRSWGRRGVVCWARLGRGFCDVCKRQAFP